MRSLFDGRDNVTRIGLVLYTLVYQRNCITDNCHGSPSFWAASDWVGPTLDHGNLCLPESSNNKVDVAVGCCVVVLKYACPSVSVTMLPLFTKLLFSGKSSHLTYLKSNFTFQMSRHRTTTLSLYTGMMPTGNTHASLPSFPTPTRENRRLQNQ